MTASNLAIVFAPNILRQKDAHIPTVTAVKAETAADILKNTEYANNLVAYLFQKDVEVFGRDFVSLIETYISSTSSNEQSSCSNEELSLVVTNQTSTATFSRCVIGPLPEPAMSRDQSSSSKDLKTSNKPTTLKRGFSFRKTMRRVFASKNR